MTFAEDLTADEREYKCRKITFQLAAFDAAKGEPRDKWIPFSCPICGGTAVAIMTEGRLYAHCFGCKMPID